MRRRGWWLVGALALGCSCSPYGGGSFACTDDMQCGANGVCSSGFCAFPDPNCTDSMLRYGDLSGPNSGKCVGATNPQVDAAIDMSITLPDGDNCYGSGVTACFAAPPSGTKTLNDTTINTDTSNECATNAVGPNVNDWCVIAAQTIEVQGLVTATGSRPLVLLATGTIDVQGNLFVGSSRVGPFTGAGAVPANNSTLCHLPSAPGANGGGAGGSFATVGGNGGNAGGNAGNTITAAALRGGCAGQDGSTGTPGAKGMGGGAVYLYAGTSITVGGSIDASGAAGTPGVTGAAGGGGGGSGGTIALDAPTVTNNGAIFANGGGGAEGSGTMTIGAAGNEATSIAAAPSTAPGASNGGDGGAGAAQGSAAGAGVDATGYGGGGGGGGLGVLRLYTAASIGGAGGVSPNPS